MNLDHTDPDLAGLVTDLRELHYPESVPVRVTFIGGGRRTHRCAHCDVRWPCDTEKVLRRHAGHDGQVE